MLLDQIFTEFAKKSPVAVMIRATMEYVLSAARINQIFEETTVGQYTRELAFSTVCDLLGSVTLGAHKSVHSAYQKSIEDVSVSLTSVYNKLQGVETNVSAELVRQTAIDMEQIIRGMDGGALAAPFPGYRTKILDGNCLAATEHRIFELREIAAGPLPGKSLVVLDPQLKLIIDVFPCEDGHAQERSLLGEVLETVAPRDLWIADRNFCTNGFLCGLDRRGACFVIRWHRKLAYEECGSWRQIGQTETGVAFERPVRIRDEEGEWATLRLLRLNLYNPTRDGDDELYLLTNLPEADASAIVAAELYRDRWLVETAFLHLTKSLNCELNTLGYPKAALFSFCMALLAYNVLAVTRAAMRASWGQEAGDDNVSTYHLADEISGVYRGMMIILAPASWRRFQTMTSAQFSSQLLELAKNVKLKAFKKRSRGPKKPRKPRSSSPNEPHVSTKKILDASKRR